MTDLRDRMRIYDRAPAPDYWNEVELRAAARAGETAAPVRSARPLLLLAAALLLALAVGGAALALSRLVDLPPDSSVTHLAYGLDGDIYLADWDGQNPVRIAGGEPFGENGECSIVAGDGPMWSPDGRYLAYREGQMGCTSRSVILSDADGHPVASFPGTGWLTSWSPDSTRVATWVELFETVGIYGIDGDRQALLSAPPGCVGSGDHDPLWSPDGRSVVAAGCEMPIDGQTPRRLSEDDPRSRSDWVYSPDGTRVAYATYTEDVSDRTASLVIADANGTELQVLTYRNDWDDPTGEVVFFNNIVWSPLGDRVAFAWRTMDNNASLVTSELRVLDISSGDETTIAAEPGIWGPFAYSPEGDRILHSRDVDGEMGLWSINADGSDAQLLVPGADWGDWQPLPPGSDPSATPPTTQPTEAVFEVALHYYTESGVLTRVPEPTRIHAPLPEGWVATESGITMDSDEAEHSLAISFWAVDAVFTDPCNSRGRADPPLMQTLDGLADAFTGWWQGDSPDPYVPSATEPVRTTVTGFRARYLEVRIPDDVDSDECFGGRYATWRNADGVERHHRPGDVSRIWIVEVGPPPALYPAPSGFEACCPSEPSTPLLVIDATSTGEPSPEALRELDDLIDSIRIEAPEGLP